MQPAACPAVANAVRLRRPVDRKVTATGRRDADARWDATRTVVEFGLQQVVVRNVSHVERNMSPIQ